MDTVDYYQGVVKNNKERKEKQESDSLKWRKEHYSCCGNPKSGSHRYNCINSDGELGFKNRFVQHYPAYFSVEDTDYFTLNFNTTEELLKCEFVTRWKKDVDGRRFYRYSISPRESYCPALLMVEYDEGTFWWCLGSIKSVEGLTLPEWKPVYTNEN